MEIIESYGLDKVVTKGSSARRKMRPNLLVGETGNFEKGDVLDANATSDLIKDKVDEITGGASEALDTLKEVEQKFEEIDGELEKCVKADEDGNVTLSGELKYAPAASTISTIYIDESTSDATHYPTITGDIAVIKNENGEIQYNADGTPKIKPSSENVISWIRENSKLYLGKQKEYYNDKYFIVKQYNEDYDDNSWEEFMKLPQFWWRCTTLSNGQIAIEFTNVEPASFDSDWIEWDGDTFIGCKKARLSGIDSPTTEIDITPNSHTIEDITDSIVLRSTTYDFEGNKDDLKPHTMFSQREGKKAARNRGKGFSLVTYETHKMMEILFYAFYGDVRSQLICGTGASVSDWNNQNWSNGRTMGYTPLNIMLDSRASEDPHNNFFWGLTDWWGNVYEWIDNLVVLGYHDVEGLSDPVRDLGIQDYDGNVIRVIRDIPYTDSLSIKKKWGKYADVISIDYTEDYDDYNDGGYSDNGSVYDYLGYVGYRSGDSDNSDGGVGYLRVDYDPDDHNYYYGSRLQFHGKNWAEVNPGW